MVQTANTKPFELGGVVAGRVDVETRDAAVRHVGWRVLVFLLHQVQACFDLGIFSQKREPLLHLIHPVEIIIIQFASETYSAE